MVNKLWGQRAYSQNQIQLFQMKQKEFQSSVCLNPIFFTSRSNSTKSPKHKKYYSPKLLTRRTQRKDIPISNFLRRKQSHDEPKLYKYLSPKKMHCDQHWTFLSDQNYGQTTERCLARSGFQLDFSRINAQKSEYTMAMSRSYETKNLFEDMHDEIGGQQKNAQISQRIRCFQGEDKQMPSFDTTSESFHCKDNKKVDGWFSVIVKENGRLKKQLEKTTVQNFQLREQLQFAQVKKKQIQQQLIHKQEQFQRIKQELMFTISKLQQQNQNELSQLGKKISMKNEKLSERQKQISDQHKLISNLYTRLYELESECHNKQIQCNTLNQKIDEMKEEIQNKIQYNTCLEDVILQLNVKIDQLRKDNIHLTNDLQDKTDQLQFLQIDHQRQSDILTLDDAQILSLKQQISHLTDSYESLELEHRKIINTHHKHINFSQTIDQENQLTSLQEQNSTLHSLLDFQRQHNDQLKKQLSYTHLELTFLKKNQHLNQKSAKQIDIFRQRNKKLLKKVNQLMEDNSSLQEQIQTLKKTKHQASIRKSLSPIFTNDLPKNNKEKARFASQRTNLHHPEGQASNHRLKKGPREDSDEELSFQLSPERK